MNTKHIQHGSWLRTQTLIGFLLAVALLYVSPSYAQQLGTGESPDPPASIQSVTEPDPFTGAMIYRLPFKVPPGRHGMQPDLALVYRSTNPDDPAGHGWKLELGMIERNKRLNPTDSGFFTSDHYTFRLGGVTQDLVRVTAPPNPPAGLDGEYRAQIEGAFTRFRHFKISQPSTDYWEATDRLGRTYRFGSTAAPRVTHPTDPSKIYEWLLDQTRDPHGNCLNVTYNNYPNDSRVYLHQIIYTGTIQSTDCIGGTSTIKFYQQTGGDTYTVQFPDFVTETRTALRYLSIEMRGSDGVHDVPVRIYSLSYNTDGTFPRRLTSIQEHGKDASIDANGNIMTAGTTLPPVSFAYTTSSDAGGAHLLKTVSNGFGGVTTLAYQIISLTAPSDAYDAIITQSVQVDDSRGHVGTTTYEYTGGSYTLGAREFRGFSKTSITGPGAAPDQRVTEMWFLQGNGLGGSDGGGDNAAETTSVMRGKQYRIKVTNSAAPPATKVFSDTTTTYQGPINITSPSFNPPMQVDVSFPSTGKTTSVIYSYDTTYGNLIRENQYGDLSTTNDDRTVVHTFAAPNTAAWIIGLPASEEIYTATNLPSPPPIANRKAATYLCYDGTGTCTDQTVQMPTKGDLTKRSQLLTTGVLATTTMAYDAFGNLISLIDPNDSRNERTYIYDSTNTYLLRGSHPLLPGTGYKAEICIYHVDTTYYGVTKSGDPGNATSPCLGQEQPLPPNPGFPAAGFYGQPALIRDENDQNTAFEYDALGRQSKVTRPDSSYTLTLYQNFGTVSNQRIRREDYETSGTLLRFAETYFDGQGRTYETRTTGPDSKTIITQTTFDNRGNVATRTLPFFLNDPVRSQTYLYDPLGRVLTTTNPDNSLSRACYDDWISVAVDANGHQRRETRDAFTRIITMDEFTGTVNSCSVNPGTAYATTSYEYDAVDNLTRVKDAQNNETSFIYDNGGRRTQLADPDSGTTTATYRPAGQLETQTDAKGQEIRLTPIDHWSRPAGKTSIPTGINVEYHYDENGRNGFGRLTAVIENATTVNLFYDQLGRMNRTDQITGGTTYTTQFAFDALGRMKTVTYPDSSVVTYNYSGPFLASVTEGATTYATFSAYNALGQPGAVTFGNTVTTTLTYHDQNFRLLRRLTSKNSNAYQDMRYGYDAGGNVTAILDSIFGTQTFRYDDLDRLISATGPYGSGGIQDTRMFGYDKIGNLTLHCTLGDLVYPASGPGSVRPHAVSASALGSYTYDNNGNLLLAPDGFAIQSGDYDFENRPKKITKGATTTEFTYHDLLGRVTKKVSGTTTTYVGRWYECTGGTCRKYIYAGDQRIALKEGSTVTAIHTDHLGSSSVLTNGSDGSKTEQVTYFPFGQTRTDTDGAGTPVSPGFRYKYTDQEFDDTTGLYYYKARYYDPVLGRFIQPDPIVSILRNPQAWNRYTYVLNNPLKYTDPTGHYEDLPDNTWFGGGFPYDLSTVAGVQKAYDVAVNILSTMGSALVNLGGPDQANAAVQTGSSFGGVASLAGVPAIPADLGGVPATLVAIILAEAGGQNIPAKFAVADVVKNRVEDTIYEFRGLGTYSRVITQPSAFAGVNSQYFPEALNVLAGNPNTLNPGDTRALVDSFHASYLVYNNILPDITNGALYFYSPGTGSRQPAYIASGLVSGSLIGVSPPGVNPNEFLFYRRR